MTAVASQLNEEEITDLMSAFAAFDKNNDGMLTIEEIEAGLSNDDIPNGKILLEMFDSVDTDKSGTIDYTEFLAATMEKGLYLKEEKLYAAFKLFDKNEDGLISAEELQDVLGSKPTIGLDVVC